MPRSLPFFVFLITLLCPPAAAFGATVTESGDSGLAEELRTLLEDPSGTGQAYTFAPGVNPGLDPAKGPVAVDNLNRTLIGNGQDMAPTANIFSHLGGLGADPYAIEAFMNGAFGIELENALSLIDADDGRTVIHGNNSPIFYWYKLIDAEDSSKYEGKGYGDNFGFSNLALNSGLIDLGDSAVHGGGVVGAYQNLSWKITKDISSIDYNLHSQIGDIGNTVFENIEVSSTAKLEISGGGGVVGAAATSAVENRAVDNAIGVESSMIRTVASVGNINNSLFRSIKISAPNDKFSGGGVIGVMVENSIENTNYSTTPHTFHSAPQVINSTASLGNITGNIFSDIEIDVSKLNGGGVIGLSASPAISNTSTPPVNFGDVTGNVFTDISVNASKAIEGGGIIGMKVFSSPSTTVIIDNISNNLFNNITVNAFNAAKPGQGGDLEGGGIIGITLFSDNQAQASLELLDNLVFNNISIKTGALKGSGLVGAMAGAFNDDPALASATAYVARVHNNYMMNTKVEAFEIQGGGLIGVGAKSNGPAKAQVGEIIESYFINNSFSASGSSDTKEPLAGDIWGGLIYTSGNSYVRNSIFANNKFSASGTVYSSAITMDTAFHTDPYASGQIAPHSLSLQATDGKTTLLADDWKNPSSTIAGIYFGSLKLGEIKVPDPDKPGELMDKPINLPSQADGELNIFAQADAKVILLNPIIADMTDSKAHDQSQPRYSFDMYNRGDGQFTWGGRNEILLHESARTGLVQLEKGTTILTNNYGLNAPHSDFNLFSGANLQMDIGTEPYFINANSIDLQSGSSIRLPDTGRIYSPRILGPNDPLLSLSAANGITKNSSLGSGYVEIGFYDYDYELAWQGDNLVLAGDRRENTARAAVSAITAPGAIVTSLPGSAQVFRRVNSSLGRGGAGWPGGLNSGAPADLVTAGGSDPENLGAQMWITPAYGYSSQKSGGRLSGYDLSIPSVSIGADRRLGGGLLGVSLALAWPNYDSPDADVDAVDVTGLLYGGLELPLELDLALMLGYGHTSYEQTRRAHGQRISAEYHSNNFTAGAGLSRTFELEPLNLRPLVTYEYLHIDVHGYDEGYGANNLKVEGYSQSIHRLKAGLEAEYVSPDGLRAGGSVYYLGLYGDREGKTRAAFNIDPGRNFLPTRGNPVDENSLGLGIFAALPLAENASLNLGYDFLAGDDLRSHQASLSFKITF